MRKGGKSEEMRKDGDGGRRIKLEEKSNGRPGLKMRRGRIVGKNKETKKVCIDSLEQNKNPWMKKNKRKRNGGRRGDDSEDGSQV